jgi:hypothetical protein
METTLTGSENVERSAGRIARRIEYMCSTNVLPRYHPSNFEPLAWATQLYELASASNRYEASCALVDAFKVYESKLSRSKKGRRPNACDVIRKGEDTRQ